jgi:hypothetical protein
MSNVVLLVLWLSLPVEQPPAFQVIVVTQSVKECSAVKDMLEKANKDAKGRVSCLQVLTPLKDAGKEF